MNMTINYSKAIIAYCSWCGLGYIRGINSYKYSVNKYNTEEPHLYITSFLSGFYGIFVYFNPVFLPYLMTKELYRLEVNLRNLENEKNSRFYNEIL